MFTLKDLGRLLFATPEFIIADIKEDTLIIYKKNPTPISKANALKAVEMIGMRVLDEPFKVNEEWYQKVER
jgi:hypothetical protein